MIYIIFLDKLLVNKKITAKQSWFSLDVKTYYANPNSVCKYSTKTPRL